jgi:hypothetical protein
MAGAVRNQYIARDIERTKRMLHAVSPASPTPAASSTSAINSRTSIPQ